MCYVPCSGPSTHYTWTEVLKSPSLLLMFKSLFAFFTVTTELVSVLESGVLTVRQEITARKNSIMRNSTSFHFHLLLAKYRYVTPQRVQRPITHCKNGIRFRTGTRNFSSNLCVQTGSGAHSASCTLGTGGSFPPGVKRGRGVKLTTHPIQS
jgi:hypothetical protein